MASRVLLSMASTKPSPRVLVVVRKVRTVSLPGTRSCAWAQTARSFTKERLGTVLAPSLMVVGDCAVPAKASERTKAATTRQGLWWGKCMRDIPVLLAGRKPKRWFVSTKAKASEAALELADEVRLPGKLETVIQKLGGF